MNASEIVKCWHFMFFEFCLRNFVLKMSSKSVYCQSCEVLATSVGLMLHMSIGRHGHRFTSVSNLTEKSLIRDEHAH